MKFKKTTAVLLSIIMLSTFCLSVTSCLSWLPFFQEEEKVPQTEIETATPFGNIKTTDIVKNATDDVEITLVRGKKVLATDFDQLTYDGQLEEGDIIELKADYTYLNVNLFQKIGSTLLYSPTGRFSFKVPDATTQKIYESGTFTAAQNVFSASVATDNEVAESRNLSLNPYDFMFLDEKNNADLATLPEETLTSVAVKGEQVAAYPHAYANRVTRNEAGFYARNAIDGKVESDGHGNYPYQSWGYNQKEDAEFVLYFGREVELFEIGFVLRANFSGTKEHDTYWEQVTVEFSDGSMQMVDFTKSGAEQKVQVNGGSVVTDSIRLKDMRAKENANSEMFAALTEFKAYGKELTKKNALATKTSVTSTFGGKKQSSYLTSEYSAEEIKETMMFANDWFINRTQNGDYKIPDHNGSMMVVDPVGQDWKDAVYYSGLTEAFMTTGDMKLYYAIRSTSNSFNWQMNKGINTPHGDWYQIGETYLILDDLLPSAYKTAQVKSNAQYNINRGANDFPSDDGVYYDKSRDWSNMSFWWCDALYMAMNYYTLLSMKTGDKQYVEAAFNGYQFWKEKLYNEKYDLWHRDQKNMNNTTNSYDADGNKLPEFWARGNGWVFAALAKQLLYLDPVEYPEIYETYKQDYLKLAASIAKYQRSDGTWNVSIIDETFYGGKEATGTCGFVYGYCVGLQLGVIRGMNYVTTALNGYEGMLSCMLKDNVGNLTGQVGYMQTTGYQPQNYKSEAHSKEFTHEFGMGLFMLASSAMMRMCSDYSAPTVYLPADVA